MDNRNFNAQLWLKSVASRFRDDYTERQQTEITGANGGAIKTESVVAFDASQLGKEQRDVARQMIELALSKK